MLLNPNPDVDSSFLISYDMICNNSHHIELPPSSQTGGEVVYFKNGINYEHYSAVGQVCTEEDYYPPHWVGISAPTLERRAYEKYVQDMKGDVLFRA